MDVRRRVFPITRSLWVGPFASPERLPVLMQSGITHLLNVGDAPSVLTAQDGAFREVVWHPICDLQRIPEDDAADCLGHLHRMVCEPGASVYVHCIAGWNRSPTITWLYLIACGLSAATARSLIEGRAWDAVPGHSRLVDATILDFAQKLGLARFLPHPRPEALEPSAPAAFDAVR